MEVQSTTTSPITRFSISPQVLEKPSPPSLISQTINSLTIVLRDPNSSLLTKSSVFQKNVKDLTDEQLATVLKNFFDSFPHIESKEKFTLFLEQLAKALPLEKMQRAIKTLFPAHVDAFTSAQDMAQKALCFLEKTKRNHLSLNEKTKSLLQSLLSVLETMISVFGVHGFFKHSENEYEADTKFERILKLANFFSLLTTALIPLIGIAIGGVLLGITLLTIIVLSLAYPLIKPIPTTLPFGKNWTNLYKQQEFVPTIRRMEVVDELAATLISNTGPKRHPLLVGPSGVGKTQIIKHFIGAIEQGKYPELKGKKVFYFNPSNILEVQDFATGQRNGLKKILSAMGRHREDIFVVFDELQGVFENTEFLNTLKTTLDTGSDTFPHFIGITNMDFQTLSKKDDAFARRFKPIQVKESNPMETAEILGDYLLQETKGTLITPGIIQKLVEKTKENFKTPEPATSLSILTKCLTRITETQKSPLIKSIEQMRNEILLLKSQRALLSGTDLLSYSEPEEKLSSLEAQVASLEKALQEKNKKIQELFQLKDLLFACKKAMFEIAVSVKQKDKEKLALFLLQSHFLLPSLDKHIRRRAQELGVRIELTEELLNEVIQNEKKDEFVAQGRQPPTLQARAKKSSKK